MLRVEPLFPFNHHFSFFSFFISNENQSIENYFLTLVFFVDRLTMASATVTVPTTNESKNSHRMTLRTRVAKPISKPSNEIQSSKPVKIKSKRKSVEDSKEFQTKKNKPTPQTPDRQHSGGMRIYAIEQESAKAISTNDRQLSGGLRVGACEPFSLQDLKGVLHGKVDEKKTVVKTQVKRFYSEILKPNHPKTQKLLEESPNEMYKSEILSFPSNGNATDHGNEKTPRPITVHISSYKNVEIQGMNESHTVEDLKKLIDTHSAYYSMTDFYLTVTGLPRHLQVETPEVRLQTNVFNTPMTFPIF